MRQRLREAQVRVHVHQADLAAEVAGTLGALEQPLRPTVVTQRAVEQPQPVSGAQVAVDEQLIARMQQVAHASVLLEADIAGEHPIDQQQTLEVTLHGAGRLPQPFGFAGAADAHQRLRQRHQHLKVQRHGPGTAHVFAHARIGRLQRIVPVAVAVGRERGACERAALDER